MSKLVPRYTLWESINTAIALGMRALEEIRTLARQPGPKGNDGLGFDDMKFIHDGERGFSFQFIRGKEVKDYSFTIPAMIYRDVFRDGEKYVSGDAVTWGGSLWIAKAETSAKPGESPDWKLAVKKGRDGKEIVSLPRDPVKPVSIRGNGNGPDNH